MTHPHLPAREPSAEIAPVPELNEMTAWIDDWYARHETDDGVTLNAELLADFLLTQMLRQRPSPQPEAAIPIRVDVGCLTESNGRKTWCVSLYREGATVFEGFQVYSSASEGRARYCAEEYKHLFGQAPKPNVLKFDTDLPSEPPAPSMEAEIGEIEKRLLPTIRRLRLVGSTAEINDYVITTADEAKAFANDLEAVVRLLRQRAETTARPAITREQVVRIIFEQTDVAGTQYALGVGKAADKILALLTAETAP